MSDRQTSAMILLVVLALVFYLYTRGNLSKAAALVTGAANAGNTANSTTALNTPQSSGTQNQLSSLSNGAQNLVGLLSIGGITGLNSSGN